jgi:general secretion pathway protein K
MTVWGQGAVNVNTANAQTLLALVLAGSKKSKLWTDPVEMQKFFMGLTMFKAFTSGIPLFSSPQDFMSKMKGSLPTMLGIAPVQFDAETEFVKAITTESKVFSIYSDGYVTGYQRKTRVRIHAVVDFRQAPAPMAASLPGAPAGPPGSPAPPAGGGATAPGSTTASVDAIQAAVAPNPGGTVIYYRME